MNFDRVAKVEFSGVNINPVTDLRIQFALEKNDSIKFNRGTISIYNLSERARNTLARPHHLDRPMAEPIITVGLTAGYRGSEARIFAGDVVTATNQRIGPDWITTMELFTGYNAATKARTIESIDGRTAASVILDRIIAPMQLDVRVTDAAKERLKNQQLPSYSTSGLTYRVTADFLSRFGLAFTIDEDGQGLIYVDDKPKDPDSGQTKQNTYSPQTGMIGTPKITYTGVMFRTLLRPEAKLIQKIFVESETISGTLRAGGGSPTGEYYITGLKHSGDNRADDWYTDIEAVYANIAESEYGDL